jgi:hypothetical protein
MTDDYDPAALAAQKWRDTGDPTQLVIDLLDPTVVITPAARAIIADCLEHPPRRSGRGRPKTGRQVAYRFLEAVDIRLQADAIRAEEPGIPAEALIADIAEERGIPESRVSAALYPRAKSR